jgi:hypothetical protein
MRENELGRRVTKALRDQGAMVYPLWAGTMVPEGWPDKLVWSPIWHGLLELKAASGSLRSSQIFVLKQLWERCPGRVWVVYGTNSEYVAVHHPADGLRLMWEGPVNCLLKELEKLCSSSSETGR